jgi:CTP synthase
MWRHEKRAWALFAFLDSYDIIRKTVKVLEVAVPTKFVFVTGGVLSGLGKGITAASIGNLLKARGLKVNLQKCDPYLNIDAGTLNPREHGECFVTKDGAETDLDLGHYERFLDEELTQKSSVMSGRVMLKVIEDERNGLHEGKTVQIIPHFTNAIQKMILDAAEGFDVHIVEIGGTVGDYESLSFIEAIRELGMKVGRENCAYVHVVYLPYLGTSQESKTKPAQNSVRELRGFGITPDILAARSEEPTPESVKAKLSLFSGLSEDAIALLPNARSIYQVPLTLEDSGVGRVLCERLGFSDLKPDLADWKATVERATSVHTHKVRVGVVAKYLDNQDTYMSVFEALRSAGWWNDADVEIKWIDAEPLVNEEVVKHALSEVDGIVVPGGFGTRGGEGKIQAAQYALKHGVPYLGLCLGLQMAVIAAARNAGLAKANTVEFDPDTPDPVIHTMEDQRGKENTGGTMRLGNYDCTLQKDSLAAKLYGKEQIVERHRHRYECNNDYRKSYEDWGIRAVGANTERGLVEVIEGINHPFFMASQYHPEFKSRPARPHPMFRGFIESLLQLQAEGK